MQIERMAAYCLVLFVATESPGQSSLSITDVQLPQVCLAGGSIPLDFLLENRSNEELPIRFDAWGLPMDLITVSDLAGKLVERRGLPARSRVGPGMPDRETEFSSLRPNEKIRLSYDLAAIYEISFPGAYQLRIKGRETGVEFSCHSYRIVESRLITGRYQSPWTITQVTGSSCSLRLSIVETDDRPATARFLLIDQLATANDRIAPLYNPCIAVDPDSTISRCEFDFLGQLWIVLGPRGKNSLHVWRLDSMLWTTLIPRTDREIEIRATRARSYIRDANVVIAGIRGADQLTSYGTFRR